MQALPYYKWHWQDWRANRRVQRMPWQAKGPYRELLDEFWAEGSLPVAMGELADIVGCTEAELADLWVHIGPCWEERDGRLYNRKMDEQRTAQDKARVAMANGGREGGKASNSHTRSNPKPILEVPKAMPDIEEKRREEKTKEDKYLAPTASAAVAGPKERKRKEEKPVDSRFTPFRLAFESHNIKTSQSKGSWNAREATRLSEFLAATPDITLEAWQRILENRARSDIPQGQRLAKWIADCRDYYRCPLDRFGKPKESQPVLERRYMQ